MDWVEQLSAIPLFEKIPSGIMQHLFSVQGMKIVQYSKDQVLYLQADVCSSLDVVLSGAVSIQSVDGMGNVYKPKVLERGESLGATLLFGKYKQYPMTVVADSEAIVLQIKKSALLLLCEEKEFLVSILSIISNRAHELSQTVNRISSTNLRTSLLFYLQTLSRSQQSRSIVLPVSKTELANRLGCSRTSLQRQFTLLAKEGLLSYTGRSITLHISSKR